MARGQWHRLAPRVDLNRDPRLPGRDPGVRPAHLHGPELAVRAPQWLWANAAGLELEPEARTTSRPDNNPAPTPLALFCARPQERIDDAVNQAWHSDTQSQSLTGILRLASWLLTDCS